MAAELDERREPDGRVTNQDYLGDLPAPLVRREGDGATGGFEDWLFGIEGRLTAWVSLGDSGECQYAALRLDDLDSPGIGRTINADFM
jgi:hypothetical protein